MSSQETNHSRRILGFIYDEEIDSSTIHIVKNAINCVLALGKAERKIDLLNLGPWQEYDWKEKRDKLDYHRNDKAFLRREIPAQNCKNHKLNADLLECSINYDILDDACNCVLCVVSRDLFDERSPLLIGSTRSERCAICSTARFTKSWIKEGWDNVKCKIDSEPVLRNFEAQEQGLLGFIRIESIKTSIMHELGHLFGLLPDDEADCVEDSLGLHCTNECIMRQGLKLPEDWIRYTFDRLKSGPFCPRCLRLLQEFSHWR